jgi:hypothetical protein
MPVYRNIDDFTPGNTYAVIRSVNAPSNGTDSPSEAWLTVKSNLTDNDSMAAMQIHITTSPTSNGVVTVNADRSATLTFVCLISDSTNLTSIGTYLYDIKVKMLPSSYAYTLEAGKFFTTERVTTLPST